MNMKMTHASPNLYPETLRAYLADLDHCPSLSQEEIEALVKEVTQAVAQGQQEHVTCLQQRLIEAHLRGVVSIASACWNQRFRHLKLLDLIQEGNLGVIKAVSTYHYEHPGGRFSSWVWLHVRYALINAIPLDKTITISRDIFRRERERGKQQQLRVAYPLRLEHLLSDDPDAQALLDLVAAPVPLAVDEQEQAEKRAYLQRLLTGLTECERRAMELLYSLDEDGICPPTYSEVAAYLGTTTKAVTAAQYRALRKLPLLAEGKPVSRYPEFVACRQKATWERLLLVVTQMQAEAIPLSVRRLGKRAHVTPETAGAFLRMWRAQKQTSAEVEGC